MKKRTFIVKDIEWDTDGDKRIAKSLPEEITIEVPPDIEEGEELEEYLGDQISNETGYCHFGFEFFEK